MVWMMVMMVTPQALRQNDNTVAGTITRVRLEHFMCHDELDW